MKTEPWLRGPIEQVHPLLAPILYSFQQAREDLHRWTEGLSSDQLWARPLGLGSIGFHIRHIGGSVERLMTYAMGGQLTAPQLAELEREMEQGQTHDGLLNDLERRFQAAERQVRTLDPARLTEPREVGRKRLPSTLGGLLTHIAEHTQRHVGEAIVTVKVIRATTQTDTAPAHP
ncbi:MAG TPA: DinB family protein [Bryobacteraceae bacterium]|nr:DinB family protein [Bryobacteraceae bacterium]